jgi:hypothetical protein
MKTIHEPDKFDLARNELEKFCTYSKKYNCVQVFCKLHGQEYLGEHTYKSHACLGCNLNDALYNVYRFLKQNRSKKEPEYTFTGYILLSYLLVEKLTTIFRVIGISQDYVEENWKVLIEIRKWANFVKHPKGFLFSHHADYVIETEVTPGHTRGKSKITFESVVQPLYNREDENKFKESIRRLGNKKDLLVIIPDPQRIAIELTKACDEFCEKIKNNEHFRNILKTHSVIDDYPYDLTSSR